ALSWPKASSMQLSVFEAFLSRDELSPSLENQRFARCFGGTIVSSTVCHRRLRRLSRSSTEPDSSVVRSRHRAVPTHGSLTVVLAGPAALSASERSHHLEVSINSGQRQ